jgi:putative spermidine/putrescine transport system permease protein
MQLGLAKSLQPSRTLLVPVLAFLAAFYLLPGFLVALMSAGHPPSFTLRADLFTPAAFTRMFGSLYYLKVLWRTLALGFAVGAVTAVFGYPVAYFLVRSSSPFRRALYFLTLIPMAVGMNMITLGWLVVLGRHGFINSTLVWLGIIRDPLSLMYSWGAMIVGLANVLFTFMVLPITAVLKNIDPSIEKAARNLGAGAWRTFLFVTLPLSAEGIASGFLVVFMLASGSLVLPMMLGGQGQTILPMLIWEQFSVANDPNNAAALAMVLLVFSLIVLVLQLRVTRLRRGRA